MTEKVKCSVNNCHYWDNSICTADEIEVSTNFTGGSDMEAGSMGSALGLAGMGTDMEAGDMGNESDSSNQTKCVTFKPGK